jgi:hypothetical protein
VVATGTDGGVVTFDTVVVESVVACSESAIGVGTVTGAGVGTGVGVVVMAGAVVGGCAASKPLCMLATNRDHRDTHHEERGHDDLRQA